MARWFLCHFLTNLSDISVDSYVFDHEEDDGMVFRIIRSRFDSDVERRRRLGR